MAPCRCRSWPTSLLVSPRQDFSTFLAPVRVPQCRAGRVHESRTVNLAAAEVAIDSSASSCFGTPSAATPGSALSAASSSTRRASWAVHPHEFLKTRENQARCRQASAISELAQHHAGRVSVDVGPACRVRPTRRSRSPHAPHHADRDRPLQQMARSRSGQVVAGVKSTPQSAASSLQRRTSGLPP